LLLKAETHRAFDEAKSELISPKSTFSINSLSIERIAQADNRLSPSRAQIGFYQFELRETPLATGN